MEDVEIEEEFIVTILNRVFNGEDGYVYIPDRAMIGIIDENDDAFVDEFGNTYGLMDDPKVLHSERACVYYDAISLDELQETMGKDYDCIEDAILDYEYDSKRRIYFVSEEDKDDILVMGVSFPELRNTTKEEMKENIREYDNKIKKNSTEKNNSSEQQKPVKNIINVNAKSKDEVNSIIRNIIDGKYSLGELKKLREKVQDEYTNIEGLLDSIELQIEASENNESFIELKEEKEEDKLFRDRIDILGLYKKVTSTLIAQDEPVRRIITEIARKEQNPGGKRRGILITGSSGVGKTKMMELIAKNIDKPFYKIDSTQLTVPGYTGKDIEEEFWNLFLMCGKDLKKAEHAIIFLDEIDKKGSTKKSDVSGQGVLNIMLSLIEGTTYDICEDTRYSMEKVKLNTSNMIVIFGGAFSDVYKNLTQSNEVGFMNNVEKSKIKREATPNDFVKMAQMTDEFIGRVAIVKLNDLEIDDLKRVLLESDESEIKVQKKLFEELGVRLTFDDSFIDEIVRRAYIRKTGARGLSTVIEESTWEAYGDAYSNFGEYEEIILNTETVDDPKQYIKIQK